MAPATLHLGMASKHHAKIAELSMVSILNRVFYIFCKGSLHKYVRFLFWFTGDPAHQLPCHQASNAYLDGLSLWRAASDLPFCSVQWGPVAEVGMASKAGRFQCFQ